MPVRIYFRGLIFYRFDENERLVAELISEPANRERRAGAIEGQDDHEPEIQVATGEDFRHLLDHRFEETREFQAAAADVQAAAARFREGAQAFQQAASASIPNDAVNSPHLLLLPRRLERDVTVDITVSNCEDGVRRSRSFYDYVPSIERLATMVNLPNLLKNGETRYNNAEGNTYVRNRITVNCGTIRVNEVVTWDTGFPVERAAEDRPSAPAEIKFMGVDVRGHAATECVVDVPEGVPVDITVKDSSGTAIHRRRYSPLGGRNQLSPENTTEVMIRNFEYQRVQPVPWGMDFQWLFARLGFGEVGLNDWRELDAFGALQRERGLHDLLEVDLASLLPHGPTGRPFPYIASNTSLARLNPLTGTKSRPLCIGGS